MSPLLTSSFFVVTIRNMYTRLVTLLFLIAALVTGFLFFSSEVEFVNNHIVIVPEINLMETIPLEAQVGQLFAIGHWVSIPTEVTTKRVADLQLGSIIVMDAPTNENEVSIWTDAWQASSSIPLLISIDQEGGIVSRLKSSNHTQTPQSQITTTKQAYDIASVRAQSLLTLGINANYAPVLDKSVSLDSFMYPRVFRDPAMIATLGDAMVRGYQDNGVTAVPKHFPGHPDTSDDSHITLPILNITKEQYINHTQQFADIVEAGNVQILMTAHVLIPALDPDFPATVSPIVLNDLRERIGYNSIIITDDLAMQAISDRWDYSESAVLALKAGADMVMLAAEPENAEIAVQAVLDAIENGELTRERVFEAYSRVMEVKENL